MSSRPETPGAPFTQGYLPAPAVPQPGPSVRRAQLAVLAAHLTPRDRWIAAMVHEHRVLTTSQITALGFDGARTARARLAKLVDPLRLLDRFRPRVAVGSAPEHYVLGPAGAGWLAAAYEMSVKAFGYHRGRVHQIAASAHLAHAVGCNEVFTAIAVAGRREPQAGRLVAWWSEGRCARLFADAGARPDGYGHYTTARADQDPADARSVRFFLEYDTGSEPLGKLAGKFGGYGKLAASSVPIPVLFYLPSATREANFHRYLAQQRPTFPVVTTSLEALLSAGCGPTGPVWRPVDGRQVWPGETGRRLALIDLDTLTRPVRRQRVAGSTAVHLPPWWIEPPNPLP